MFLVSVTHLSGHGQVTSPLMITSDPVKAVNLSRLVRSGHGFRFSADCFITVAGLLPEGIYIKYDGGTVPNGPSVGYLLIQRPRFGGDGKPTAPDRWDEEWIDTVFHREYLQIYKGRA